MSKVEPMVKMAREYAQRKRNKNVATTYESLLERVCELMEGAETFVLSNEVQDALDQICNSDGFALPRIEDIRLPHAPMVVQTRRRDWNDKIMRLRSSREDAPMEPLGTSIYLDVLDTALLAVTLMEFTHPNDPERQLYMVVDNMSLIIDLDSSYITRPRISDDKVLRIVTEMHAEDKPRDVVVSSPFARSELEEKKQLIVSEGHKPLYAIVMTMPEELETSYRASFLAQYQNSEESRESFMEISHLADECSMIAVLRTFAFTLVRTGVTHAPMQTTAIEKRRSPTGKVTKRPRKYNFTTVVLNAVEQVRGRSIEPIEHRSAHLVRGHFKQRKSGLFWWNPFVRGRGKLNKREAYEVTTLEDNDE